jgi:hypothetical protein
MTKENWYQIEIEDESALSGPSLMRLVRTLAEVRAVEAVVVIGAEGAGPNFATMFPSDEMVELEIGEFVNRASLVTQFDWGDFHLANQRGDLAGLEVTTPYEEVLPRTFASVRAVDDTYFYVYTRSNAAMEAVTRAYPAARVHAGCIQDLDFPS